MSDTNQIQQVAAQPLAPAIDTTLSIEQLKSRQLAIRQLIKEMFIEDVHYGKIPGCGDKPALLKAGAELLCSMFMLSPEHDVTTHDLPNGHREYHVKTTLRHAVNKTFWGQGVGMATTMESKYRYRGTAAEPTGKALPRAYWNAREAGDFKQMAKILGGPEFMAKKIDGEWQICKKLANKEENQDPADVFNTALKIAKKRALSDATLTATGTSGEFTQSAEDLEEMIQNTPGYVPAASDQEPSRPAEPKTNGNGGTNGGAKPKPAASGQPTWVQWWKDKHGVTVDQLERVLRKPVTQVTKDDEAHLYDIAAALKDHGKKIEDFYPANVPDDMPGVGGGLAGLYDEIEWLCQQLEPAAAGRILAAHGTSFDALRDCRAENALSAARDALTKAIAEAAERHAEAVLPDVSAPAEPGELVPGAAAGKGRGRKGGAFA